MSRVIGNLFLGGESDAREMVECDLVVNCTCRIRFFSRSAVRVRLAVEDNGEPSQSDELYRLVSNDSIFREIYRHLRGGDRILIHCHMGAQRSAAVAACFLLFLWSHRKINRPLDVNAVIRIIRRKRAEAFPRSVHFRSTIERYYAKALRRRRGAARRRRRASVD